MEWVKRDEARKQGDLFSPQRHKGHEDFLAPSTASLGECAEFRFFAARATGSVVRTRFALGEMEWVERDEARKQGDLFSPQRHKGHEDFLAASAASLGECAELRFVAFRSSGMVAPTSFALGEMEWVERDEARKQGDLFSPQRHKGHEDFLPPSTASLGKCTEFTFFAARASGMVARRVSGWARWNGLSGMRHGSREIYFHHNGTKGTKISYHRVQRV